MKDSFNIRGKEKSSCLVFQTKFCGPCIFFQSFFNATECFTRVVIDVCWTQQMTLVWLTCVVPVSGVHIWMIAFTFIRATSWPNTVVSKRTNLRKIEAIVKMCLLYPRNLGIFRLSAAVLVPVLVVVTSRKWCNMYSVYYTSSFACTCNQVFQV